METSVVRTKKRKRRNVTNPFIIVGVACIVYIPLTAILSFHHRHRHHRLPSRNGTICVCVLCTESPEQFKLICDWAQCRYFLWICSGALAKHVTFMVVSGGKNATHKHPTECDICENRLSVCAQTVHNQNETKKKRRDTEQGGRHNKMSESNVIGMFLFLVFCFCFVFFSWFQELFHSISL